MITLKQAVGTKKGIAFAMVSAKPLSPTTAPQLVTVLSMTVLNIGVKNHMMSRHAGTDTKAIQTAIIGLLLFVHPI